MLELHHFSFSWQLIPEKGTYGESKRPKSGTLKIRTFDSDQKVMIEHHWVNLNNLAFETAYIFDNALGETITRENNEKEEIIIDQKNQYDLTIQFKKSNSFLLKISLELLPNGHLKMIKEGIDELMHSFIQTEYYHKQYSVLPYASSVGAAIIKPTEEGLIRHKALSAMEEQTNMQLDQIRKQIELLAQQAQEIYKRKELSMKIYDAKLTFQPVIGHTYHLYSKRDESIILSLISPDEWGRKTPFEKYHGAVKMLADHTWIEAQEQERDQY